MLTFWIILISGLYLISIFGLAIYGCHRLWLLTCWYYARKKRRLPVFSELDSGTKPFVTIQLPLYNERFVAERLITAAAKIDWPRDRFEIQVLDDSTDETGRIVEEQAQFWRQKGVSIEILRRKKREGFKAGALNAGMQLVRGEFIAIFDADFIPEPHFLHRIMHHFNKPEVGMVQSRWAFLNENHSWLTRIQSFLIGSHFSIEHFVRYRRGLFFNFNGTGGVWRRCAIEEAGGWQADTVTEDLDLSYRAQMTGWRFIYLDDLVTPSELPHTLSAFRIQQQRWAKGSVQTARKTLPRLIRSGRSMAVKIEACAHLLANLGWLFGTTIILLIYPMILSRIDLATFNLERMHLPLMGMGTLAVLFYYLLYAASRSGSRGLLWLPLVPIVSIGIAPAVAMSVIQGLFFRGGSFVRTPKYGTVGRSALPSAATIYFRHSHIYLLLDIAFALYTLLPVYHAWQKEAWMAIPMLGIFPVAFILVAMSEFAGLRAERTV